MNMDFLNNKNVPTPNQLLRAFFGAENNYKEIKKQIIEDYANVDFDALGEPDHIKSIKGTEWIIYRFEWNTPKGKVFRIDVRKVENNFTNPIYPYGVDIIDIEPVIQPNNLSFNERLDLALEQEDYEEAARLRDWNDGLKRLLLKHKKGIIQAIDNGNVGTLDNIMADIRAYRDTL